MDKSNGREGRQTGRQNYSNKSRLACHEDGRPESSYCLLDWSSGSSKMLIQLLSTSTVNSLGWRITGTKNAQTWSCSASKTNIIGITWETQGTRLAAWSETHYIENELCLFLSRGKPLLEESGSLFEKSAVAMRIHKLAKKVVALPLL